MKNDNWFLNQQHLFYTTKAEFDRDLNTRNIHKKSVAFIDEGKLIWTHGKFFKCDDTQWSNVIQLISNLRFYKIRKLDGSTTYELRGVDASGNTFPTGASFNIFEDVIIKGTQLSDDGKTLSITLANGDVIDIDLTKLLQLTDFQDTDSVDFVSTQDPNDSSNMFVEAYARQLVSATDPNIKVIAGSDNVTITGSQGSSIIVGNNGDANNGIFIESENNVNIQGNSVTVAASQGDLFLEASGGSVKVNSPLYLSEEYPDVESKLTEIDSALEDIYERIDSGTNLTGENGIKIENGKVSVDSNEYFEPKDYWDNNN